MPGWNVVRPQNNNRLPFISAETDCHSNCPPTRISWKTCSKKHFPRVTLFQETTVAVDNSVRHGHLYWHKKDLLALLIKHTKGLSMSVYAVENLSLKIMILFSPRKDTFIPQILKNLPYLCIRCHTDEWKLVQSFSPTHAKMNRYFAIFPLIGSGRWKQSKTWWCEELEVRCGNICDKNMKLNKRVLFLFSGYRLWCLGIGTKDVLHPSPQS